MSATATKFDHKVVSKDQWRRVYGEFLNKEKELTRQSDELARQRRELPWVLIDKEYMLEGPAGKIRLADLFQGRRQLAVYHFMFGPDWAEGCPGCSYVADHLNGALEHLQARDVSLVLVSRAPLEKLTGFERRMGWKLPWFSSQFSDFNRDFGVAFTKEEVASGEKKYNFNTTAPHGEENPGMSFFIQDESGAIYHTYSTFGRGLETLLGTYSVLDRSPKGRDEEGLPAPMSWVRHHDKYETNKQGVEPCCQHKADR